MPEEYTALHAAQNRWPVLKSDTTPGMRKVALDRPVCVIGARSRVHLPLPSQLVSKSHAIIVHESDGVYLRDLASRNRTFVNNRAVRETRLRDSDVIRFGPFSFHCHSGFGMTADSDPKPAGELRVDSERGGTRVLALSKQTFLIGSRYSCDLMLTGDDISLAHAIIFEREGKRFVRDLTSLSGTLVNEQAIREAELHTGDIIRIGHSTMHYGDIEQAVTRSQVTLLDGDGETNSGSGIPTGDLTVYSDDSHPDPGVSGSGVHLPWEKSPPMVFEMQKGREE
jgi:pSer/pThr/pTyr-binding forkhead associated (FHA) protein